MKIHINLLPYLNRMEDAAELLNRWNGGIEILMDGPNWKQPLEWELERQRFEPYSHPKSVHAPIWELNLASARFEEIRKYSFEVYKQSVEWSASIGAEQVIIHPNLYSAPIFLRRESQECAKENLMRLGEAGQKLGIQVVVENVGFGSQFALFDEEEFVQLFEEIPTIKALVDIGHAHINGWDTPSLIRKLGTRLCAVHIHDNDGIGDLHLPVGQGTIDWQPVWEALRSLEHFYRATLEYREETPMEILLQHAGDIEKELEGQFAK